MKFMLKKYITKIVKSVLEERKNTELSCGLNSQPVSGYDSRWIDERIDRLNSDLQGLAEHLGLERTFGTKFVSTKKKK